MTFAIAVAMKVPNNVRTAVVMIKIHLHSNYHKDCLIVMIDRGVKDNLEGWRERKRSTKNETKCINKILKVLDERKSRLVSLILFCI